MPPLSCHALRFYILDGRRLYRIVGLHKPIVAIIIRSRHGRAARRVPAIC